MVAPFVEDEEDQPAKDGHEKQHLRNEFNKDVDVALEVTVLEERETGEEGEGEGGREGREERRARGERVERDGEGE